MPKSKIIEFIEIVKLLKIFRDEEEMELIPHHLLDICNTFNLSVYDSFYLDLAMRKGFPLATCDEGLIEAAKMAGVTLVH